MSFVRIENYICVVTKIRFEWILDLMRFQFHRKYTWNSVVRWMPKISNKAKMYILSAKSSRTRNITKLCGGTMWVVTCCSRWETVCLTYLVFQGAVLMQNTTARIVFTSQSLVLQSIGRENAGNYTCNASNDRGNTTSSSVMLRVQCTYSLQFSNTFSLIGSVTFSVISCSIFANHFSLFHAFNCIFKW